MNETSAGYCTNNMQTPKTMTRVGVGTSMAVMSATLDLEVQPQTFFLVQLSAKENISHHLLQRLAAPLHDTQFLSITRTKSEVSIVSDFRIDGGTEPPTEWRCLRVKGPMNLSGSSCVETITVVLC